MKTVLSKRQSEIMRLVFEGETNKRIADKLKLDPGTVANYLRVIFVKLGAKNRAQAVGKMNLL